MFVNPTATSPLDTQRLEFARQVFLIRGRQRGKPVWVYARISKANLATFRHMLGKPGLDVAQYGEILYSGWGDEPPAAVVNQLKKEVLQ